MSKSFETKIGRAVLGAFFHWDTRNWTLGIQLNAETNGWPSASIGLGLGPLEIDLTAIWVE